MRRDPILLTLSAAAWAGFVAVTLWTIAFLADIIVSPTVDGPPRTNALTAVTVDLALLLLFAVQHSVMARPQVKAVLRRRIPAALERTSYVLATDICLVLVLVLWQPWGGAVWLVDGPAGFVLCRSARPVGSWRSRRRSLSTTLSSPGCAKLVGGRLGRLHRPAG